MNLLEARNITKRFGGLEALTDVALTIARGEIYGLIGPNGAGKTTFFNVLTGFYQADGGDFLFDGASLDITAAHKVAVAGIARTFQNIRLFGNMTALENVMVGRHVRTLELLEYVGVGARQHDLASSLPYGDQRRLEIARALATEPKLLALDEPAAGMNATETATLKRLLERIRADGTTILLIEHDVKLVMGLCDRVAVLDYGRKIAEGAPALVQRDAAVIEAYLGGTLA